MAVDTLIERRVAIKELRPPAGTVEDERAAFVERALREARNAGRLNHPAVVGVHDVVAPADGDAAVYLVMEYVEAPTLAEIIDQQGQLPAHRVAAMGLGILDALDAAHTMGIVHRDIKPGNVLISDGDRVKLTDFGIALAAEDTRLTRSGVIGTHAYLAPECFDAGQAGPASDLWSLGATLFHAVSGRPPFDRDTTTATLRAILFDDLPGPPCEPRLAGVIRGLLTRPIDQRLTSDVARRQLQPVAAEPVSPPAVNAPLTPGVDPAAWEAQTTSLHRPPIPTPPSTLSPDRAGSTYPGAGSGLAPQAPLTSSPVLGAQWTGQPPQGPNRAPWLVGGAIAAAMVVLVLVFAASGGSSDDDSTSIEGRDQDQDQDQGTVGPKAATERLLKASEDQDPEAVKAAVCEDDLSMASSGSVTSDQVVSYTIKAVETTRDVSFVLTTVRLASQSDEVELRIPTVIEDGLWKVCFSRSLDEIPDIPTATDDLSRSNLTSSCPADQGIAREVADEYADQANARPEYAQQCVYAGSVPESVTEQLGGRSFHYDHSLGDGTFVYTSADGTMITITVTEESDGQYWVTDVTVS